VLGIAQEQTREEYPLILLLAVQLSARLCGLLTQAIKHLIAAHEQPSVAEHGAGREATLSAHVYSRQLLKARAGC
jgi:hypothetical protein